MSNYGFVTNISTSLPIVKIQLSLKNISIMLPYFHLCKIINFMRYTISFVLHRKPVGRAEVLKLRHTMDALLERITIEDNDLRGQTQVFSFFLLQ